MPILMQNQMARSWLRGTAAAWEGFMARAQGTSSDVIPVVASPGAAGEMANGLLCSTLGAVVGTVVL